ncbi:MAG: rRNA maturation RNase YbeY [Candidatus Omnitrophica bacterium]|nr:rRNA maturation RNase YbeY [Candidatus Omnitrophota bacterium]MDD5591670.1 rRNA maturation RNase YbeY [Candidatus Omnitrophota bacterium]
MKKALLKACTAEGRKKPGEVTVSFVNDKRIKGINLKYLKKSYPTDVIAFDSGDKKRMFADIVISAERAVANARTFKTAPHYELYLYAVHGMLHLLGYDDKYARQKLIMDKKTTAILHKLKIKPSHF